jgi:hypothetical protein
MVPFGFFDVFGGYAGLNGGVQVVAGNALATSSAAAVGRSLTRRHEATKEVGRVQGRPGPPCPSCLGERPLATFQDQGVSGRHAAFAATWGCTCPAWRRCQRSPSRPSP